MARPAPPLPLELRQKPLVSVLTPTIAERGWFLAECMKSVEGQIFRDFEHVILEDVDRDGCAVTMNRLAECAHGEWLLPLADDDILLPACLERLAERCDDGDIIYSPPLVTGNADRWWFFQEPPVIPATALIRRELWEQLGGYDETLSREEDRHLWIAALDAGARFVRVDYPCWVYRQHSSNKSFAQAA